MPTCTHTHTHTHTHTNTDTHAKLRFASGEAWDKAMLIDNKISEHPQQITQ